MSAASTVVNINLAVPQPDPSGGANVTAKAVDVQPEYLALKGKPNPVQFKLLGADAQTQITGLRYMNMSRDYAGKWYLPVNSPQSWQTNPNWKIAHGGNWHYVELSSDGHTLSVNIDRHDHVYVYVVEWTDGNGNKYVCDPKIRND